MKKLISYISVVLFLFPLLIFAQKKTSVQAFDKSKLPDVFDAYIRNALQTWNTPGLSVVVVKNSKVVFNKAYGVQNIETKTP